MPRNKAMKFALLFFTFIGFFTQLSAQRVVNYLSLDSLSVGDSFEYTLVAKHKSGLEKMIIPDSSSFGDFIAIREIKHFKLEPQGDSVVFSLSFFGTKDTLLPIESVSIVEESGDTTDYLVASAPLFFKSVLPDSTAEFKPYKPLFTFTNFLWFVLALLLIAGLYAVWFYFSRIKSKAQNEQTEEAEVFNEVAFENPLSTLERSILSLRRTPIDQILGDPDKFYIQLGNAFRIYFESVYDFPAMEQSSSEIIRKIRSQSLDQKFIGLIAKMLRDADLVKFARFKPTQELWASHLQDALWLVDRFKVEDIGRIDALKQIHLQQETERREAFELNQKEKQEEQKPKKEDQTHETEKEEVRS